MTPLFKHCIVLAASKSGKMTQNLAVEVAGNAVAMRATALPQLIDGLNPKLNGSHRPPPST